MNILFIVFAAAILYYCGSIAWLFQGLRRLPASGTPQNLTFSVVIAARNEEQNLPRCLEGVFSQGLPEKRFEVIVVNDRSTDRTADICREYLRSHPNFTLVSVTETPEGVAPKKHAVATGIARAKNDIIVLTDADCTVPPSWLETIDRNFSPETGLVQGITVYQQVPGMNPLFFGLQAVDFLSHGIVAAAAIGAGMPLNSNANNFAFRKQAFIDAGGYVGGPEKVVSGDDDLLLQRIAGSGKWRVTFMTDPAGSVATRPTGSAGALFEQRKRWGSKTVHYSLRQKAFLSGIFLFYCGIIAAFVTGLWSPPCLAAFAAMLLVKFFGELALMLPGTAIFNQRKLRPFILPASIIQLPAVIAAVVFGVFGKFSWKGEKYRRMVG